MNSEPGVSQGVNLCTGVYGDDLGAIVANGPSNSAVRRAVEITERIGRTQPNSTEHDKSLTLYMRVFLQSRLLVFNEVRT